MGFLAVIGVAVAGAFGVTAISVGVAMVIGGVIVGAAVGALYAAVTGGNILKGLLYGAIGGAVVGGGAAVALGATAAPGTVAGGYVAGTGQALGTAGAGATGSASILGGAAATKASSLFTASNVQAVGAVASLGSAFLHGGEELDPDAQLAEAEKDRDLQRELSQAKVDAAMGQAELGLEGTMARIASTEKIAGNELEFGKEKFTKEFDESKYRYRDEKAEVEAGRKRFEAGIKDASKYVRGNVKSVSLVETSKQRNNLPSPVWSQQPQQQAPASQPAQAAPAAGQPGVPA